MEPLEAISPIDGRYWNKLKELSEHFSEFALIKNRLKVEVKYLIYLSKYGVIRKLNEEEVKLLKNIYESFSIEDANRVKEIEKEIRHDVKAVERFLREKLATTSLKDCVEFIHFALTSEDVNNIAYSLMLKGGLNVIIQELEGLIRMVKGLSKEWKNVVMLGYTHGQPASPTTVGKEFVNFAFRIENELQKLKDKKLPGKLTGATGNFNAHVLAYPNVDWIRFSKDFVKRLGLKPIVVTTQILPHDDISEILHNLVRINNILLDLAVDCWLYISMDYFKQKVVEKEVGSSTMPHKVNPIDFENAEGNILLANSLLTLLSNKLQVSRLQRDLSDSTVKRNYGVAFAHMLLAIKSIKRGLSRISVNKEKINQDLEKNYQVMSEALQILLRKHGYPDAYEKVKAEFRGKKVDKEKFFRLVKSLDIPDSLKKKFLTMKIEEYIGLARKLVEDYHEGKI